jgi:hypothetical protein
MTAPFDAFARLPRPQTPLLDLATLWISRQPDGDRVEFSGRDDGIGLPK